VSTTALFIAFSDHNAAWQRYLLLLKSLQCQHCRICCIAIISSTSSIQLSIDDFGISGAEPFHPSRKRRLFVVVPIKEQSLRKVTFDLGEQKGSVALILDDFSGQPFDVELF
jgi:hypothetical protein